MSKEEEAFEGSLFDSKPPKKHDRLVKIEKGDSMCKQFDNANSEEAKKDAAKAKEDAKEAIDSCKSFVLVAIGESKEIPGKGYGSEGIAMGSSMGTEDLIKLIHATKQWLNTAIEQIRQIVTGDE